jgi:hypothetical protein
MSNKPLVYESACIFSIIGSALGFLGMFTATFFFRFVTEKITAITNVTATEKLSPVYFALLMSAFCISFVGAIKLYRRQRTGLYFYILAQLFILFLPVFWLGNQSLSTTNAIFTAIFAGIYVYYFKITR